MLAAVMDAMLPVVLSFDEVIAPKFINLPSDPSLACQESMPLAVIDPTAP